MSRVIGFPGPHSRERRTSRRHATWQVPWPRYAVPGFETDKRYLRHKWGDLYVNAAEQYRHRLWTDEQIIRYGAGCPASWERAYARMWDYYNNGYLAGEPLLMKILGDFNFQIKNRREQLQAETVAQLVIQWLGTPIGKNFMNECERLGKDEEKRLMAIRQERIEEAKHAEKATCYIPTENV